MKNEKEILKQVLFENACDDLYYGYGFSAFLEFENDRKNTELFTMEELKEIWENAINKMSEEV